MASFYAKIKYFSLNSTFNIDTVRPVRRTSLYHKRAMNKINSWLSHINVIFRIKNSRSWFWHRWFLGSLVFLVCRKRSPPKTLLLILSYANVPLSANGKYFHKKYIFSVIFSLNFNAISLGWAAGPLQTKLKPVLNFFCVPIVITNKNNDPKQEKGNGRT